MQSFYCHNGAALFTLERGEFYVCDFSPQRFDQLMELLLEDPIAPTVDSRVAPPPPQSEEDRRAAHAAKKAAKKAAAGGAA